MAVYRSAATTFFIRTQAANTSGLALLPDYGTDAAAPGWRAASGSRRRRRSSATGPQRPRFWAASVPARPWKRFRNAILPPVEPGVNWNLDRPGYRTRVDGGWF
ncbi:MAG: hypothetical protein AMXMBFR61_26240 [Fimbriimonadales bacterium]